MSITTSEVTSPCPDGTPNVAAGLQTLSHDVESLQQYLASRPNGPTYAAVCDSIEAVRGISREVFGVAAVVEEVRDRDDPSDHVIVVNVDDSGELESILERFSTWHSRLSEIPADVRGLFRLSVNPKEE